MNDQIDVLFRDFRMLPAFPEHRLLRVTFPDADTVLEEKCRTRLQEVYCGDPPREAEERLSQELRTVTEAGYAPYFLLAAALASHCGAVGGLHILRGCGGNSYLAWLLGISETNPLPPHAYCPACGYTAFAEAVGVDSGYDLFAGGEARCPRCGARLVGEGHGLDAAFFMGEDCVRLPHFAFDVPKELRRPMYSFLESQGELQEGLTQEDIEAARCPGTEILGSPTLSALCEMEKRSGIQARSIRCEAADVAALVAQADRLPFLFHTTAAMLQKIRPTGFSGLVRALGLDHGTGTWEENAETLIGTVCELRDVIADRDDVLAGLLRYGVERETALQAARAAQTGRTARALTPELSARLVEQGAPDWYPDSLRKCAYLFPKAHCIEQARTLCRIVRYQRLAPEAFDAVVRKYAEKKAAEEAKQQQWIETQRAGQKQ